MPPDTEELTWETVQPRYAAYCIAHGAISPQEMLARDTAAYPNAKMLGFTSWNSLRLVAWKRATNRAEGVLLSTADHAEYTDWLTTEAIRGVNNITRAFRFCEAPTEVSDQPSITRDSLTGGDPHVVAVLRRVYRPDALHALCGLANVALMLRSEAA